MTPVESQLPSHMAVAYSGDTGRPAGSCLSVTQECHETDRTQTWMFILKEDTLALLSQIGTSRMLRWQMANTASTMSPLRLFPLESQLPSALFVCREASFVQLTASLMHKGCCMVAKWLQAEVLQEFAEVVPSLNMLGQHGRPDSNLDAYHGSCNPGTLFAYGGCETC